MSDEAFRVRHGGVYLVRYDQYTSQWTTDATRARVYYTRAAAAAEAETVGGVVEEVQ